MRAAQKDLTSFGHLIEGLLKEKSQKLGRRMSLNELCFRAGVDVSNLWRSMYSKKREGRPPSPHILRAIAPHLPISYTELLIKSGHTDVAHAISADDKLESNIEVDPTLSPDLKAQLRNYLQFLRKSGAAPQFA